MVFLMTVLKILAALFIFGIIIMVHEWGHFLVAKWMKVRVNEFAIGMGPKLVSWGKGETRYSLRLFPIGGFCAMEGEDDGAPTPAAMGGNADRDVADTENGVADTENGATVTESDSGSFAEKPVWRRILIVVAGATMNLILGFLVLFCTFAFCQTKAANGKAYFNSTSIAELPEDSSAYETGLRVGDTVLRVNGKRIATDMDLSMLMQSDEDGVLSMVVRRDGEKVTLPAVKFRLATDEESGTRYLIYDFKVQAIERNAWTTLKQAGKMEYSMAVMVWRSLGDLLSGRYGLNDLSGPVGTVDYIGDAVSQAVTLDGLRTLLTLIALITINVGVFNLLPLPALDGGRLLFLIIEGVTRKKIPAKYEGIVHFIGLLLLFALMIVVTFSDIRKLITG